VTAETTSRWRFEDHLALLVAQKLRAAQQRGVARGRGFVLAQKGADQLVQRGALVQRAALRRGLAPGR
jgi:hypothetical protein